MKLEKFLKLKLTEQESELGMGYGWTSPYRSILGFGVRPREEIQTYSKESVWGQHAFNTIAACVDKLAIKGMLDDNIEKSIEKAEKIMEFYSTPNIIKTFNMDDLYELMILAQIIPDPKPWPPIDREENPSLYGRYKDASYDPSKTSALLDERLMTRIFNLLFHLRKINKMFPAGKKHARFLPGKYKGRESELLNRIQRADSPIDVYNILKSAIEEMAA